MLMFLLGGLALAAAAFLTIVLISWASYSLSGFIGVTLAVLFFPAVWWLVGWHERRKLNRLRKREAAFYGDHPYTSIYPQQAAPHAQRQDEALKKAKESHPSSLDPSPESEVDWE